MVSSRWAILLCKFNDDDGEPFDRKFYDEFFTGSGIGKQNIVDYFRDVSHGMLDLSESRVFGWFNLGKSLSDYRKYFASVTTKENPNKGREALVRWAKEAALVYHPDLPKVDFSKFNGVVVAYNRPVDLFGYRGGMAAVCDSLSMKPSLVGQEMGHGYGLAHSRSDLLPKTDDNDYHDPWDIMSTEAFRALQANHPSYGRNSIGPGLNAANMDSRGWLDNSRIWTTKYGVDTEVDLRPLHRRDLRGFLALRIENFLIEFRMNEGWDAAIASPVVLVHYFVDGHSYIMDPVLDSKGDVFEIIEGEPGERRTSDHQLRIEIQDIWMDQRKARIKINYRPTSAIISEPIYHKLPFEIESPAIPFRRPDLVDIRRLIEKIDKNPEWSLRSILKSLSDISSSELLSNESIKDTIRREALERIISIANKELNVMEIPGGVAKPMDNQYQDNKIDQENNTE